MLMLSVLVLTALVLVVVNWIRWRYSKLSVLQQCGIPVPAPSFIYGNYYQYKGHSAHICADWAQSYGKVFGVYDGLTPRVIISDPEVLKSVLIRDFGSWTNRNEGMNNTMLVNMKNERWKNVRSLMSPVFSSGKLKNMWGIMNECVEMFLDVCSKSDKDEFDIYKPLQGLTLDVIASTALALKLDCQQNPDNEILGLLKNIFTLTVNHKIANFRAFPEFRSLIQLFYKFTGTQLGEPALRKKIEKHISEVLKQRKQDPESVQRHDLLQVLIDTAATAEGNKCLSDQEIISNSWMFLFAGFDTTSTALGYIVYCLAKYESEQAQVYQEIMETVDGEPLSYEHINSLPYLEAFICESLRLFPPVTHFVTRLSQKDQKVGDYFFPEGTSIEAAVFSLHHDADLWDDPESFNVQRFLGDTSITGEMYMPFGDGPRHCIGKRFAQLEIRLCIANLLLKYEVQRGNQFQDPLPLETRSIVMYPKHGISVKLVDRVTSVE